MRAEFPDRPIPPGELLILTCRWHLGRLRLDWDGRRPVERCHNQRRRERRQRIARVPHDAASAS